MKYCVLTTTAATVILTLFTAASTFAQDSDYPEEDGAYLEDIDGYNGYQNQSSNQQPYSQNGGDPCATPYYANSPECQNRSQTIPLYGQNPYGQQPMNNPYGQMPKQQNPYQQNPYDQRPTTNPFPADPNLAAKLGATQTVQFMDRQTPRGPMLAFTRKIPVGWRASGQASWRKSRSVFCGKATPHRTWSAQSPGGRSKMELWPEQIFSNVSGAYVQGGLEGCPNTPMNNTRTFITNVIMQKRPGARIQSYEEPTQQELALLSTQLSRPKQMAPDTRMHFGLKVGILRYSYSQSGQNYDEIAFVLFKTAFVVQDPMMGMGGVKTEYTSVLPVFSMRAPTGQLDLAKAEAYFGTQIDNPQYMQIVDAYKEQRVNQMARKSIAASKARMAANKMPAGGNPMSKALSDINDMSMKGYNDRNASTSYGQTGTVNAIRGVNTYNDPYSMTGTVEQSIGSGQYMYRMNDGSYISSDNPSLIGGTRLEPNR